MNRALLDDIQQGRYYSLATERWAVLWRRIRGWRDFPREACSGERAGLDFAGHKLETRVKVKIQEGPEVTISGDADQLEQLLIIWCTMQPMRCWNAARRPAWDGPARIRN